MIEIALALLVASIGLLGLFGLFPVGLQMNKTAVDETQAAIFAEQVLNGIRAQAATSRWDRIRTGVDLPAPTPDIWKNADELRVRPTPGNESEFETLRYESRGALSGGTDSYVDFGVRYRLEIYDVDSQRKSVRLHVRPGEFGSTNTYTFYTELYNNGQR